MVFEFCQLKEGLYITMYEWEKYEVKMKTYDFGPKTVGYTHKIERFRHFHFFFFFFFLSFRSLMMIMNIVQCEYKFSKIFDEISFFHFL